MKCEKESKCLYRYADNDAGYWCGKWEGCKDMNMGENEILRDYHEAKDKFRQVKILAEQNLIKPKEMAQWKDHGETVDKRYFSVGKTPAKVRAIERGPVDVNGIKNARAIAEMMDSIEAQPVDQSAKADAGKPRLSLVPPAAVEETAKVREYGCRKYPEGGRDNWRNVTIDRHFEAALRHIWKAANDYGKIDPESGLMHVSHALCDLSFVVQMLVEEKA